MQSDLQSILSIVSSWIICVIAAERSAEALTTAKIFAGLRDLFGRLKVYELDNTTTSYKLLRKIASFFSDLISCGWCTSMWCSAFYALFLPSHYFSCSADNIIIKSVAMWGLANLWHDTYQLIRRGRVKSIDLVISHQPAQDDQETIQL